MATGGWQNAYLLLARVRTPFQGLVATWPSTLMTAPLRGCHEVLATERPAAAPSIHLGAPSLTIRRQ